MTEWPNDDIPWRRRETRSFNQYDTEIRLTISGPAPGESREQVNELMAIIANELRDIYGKNALPGWSVDVDYEVKDNQNEE